MIKCHFTTTTLWVLNFLGKMWRTLIWPHLKSRVGRNGFSHKFSTLKSLLLLQFSRFLQFFFAISSQIWWLQNNTALFLIFVLKNLWKCPNWQKSGFFMVWKFSFLKKKFGKFNMMKHEILMIIVKSHIFTL